MENEHQKKKSKIIDKIIISSDKHIDILENQVNSLKRENKLLLSKKEKKVWQILTEISTVMRRYEYESNDGEFSVETKEFFQGLWKRLSKELPQALNPKIKDKLDLKRKYDDKIRTQEEVLKELKKEKKKKLREFNAAKQ